jgi:hypothetical protein
VDAGDPDLCHVFSSFFSPLICLSSILQVWALRRLSNGLDGTSFHSRLCAGSHNGHRCSCEAHNIGDDLETRASISRIIMLAEALFEVILLCWKDLGFTMYPSQVGRAQV